MDRYDAGLLLLKFACDMNPLERVLMPISSGIFESEEYVGSLSGGEDSEALAEDELELTENLLGCAFVVCQTHLAGVLSRVIRMDRSLKRDLANGVRLAPDADSKWALLGKYSPPKHGRFTSVQAIWSLANFFKHREEWPHDWSTMKTGEQVRTRDVVAALGLECGSTGNMRTGALALGMDPYSRMEPVLDTIGDWAAELQDDVRRTMGLKRQASPTDAG